LVLRITGGETHVGISGHSPTWCSGTWGQTSGQHFRAPGDRPRALGYTQHRYPEGIS